MKSSAMNKPDERLVYLALRSVFSGEDAKTRTPKAIRKQIHKHQQREDVKALLNNHNQEHVFSTAKELLENRIFESTINAKIRFPEVFSISPAQSADREQSEEEAARSEANAIKNAAEGRLDDLGPNENTCGTVDQDRTPLDIVHKPLHKHTQQHAVLPLPSLYPIYLPFKTQHRLLQQVQEILEKCCYTFAESELSAVLEKNGWDCPERVELHVWSRTLKQAQLSSNDSVFERGRPLNELLESITHLRHAAVHSIVVSVSRIMDFLIDAERLATFLQDDNAAIRIARQRGALELAIDEIKRNKEFLSFRTEKTIQDLDEKIAELRKLQNAAVDDMLSEDKIFRQSAVANLEIAIDVGASKRRVEDDRGIREVSGMEDVVESSSDTGNEGKKQCGLVHD